MSVDVQRCPICGGENACAVASGDDPSSCWCMRVSIPPALLERVPEAARGRACICAGCVERFHAGTLPILSR